MEITTLKAIGKRANEIYSTSDDNNCLASMHQAVGETSYSYDDINFEERWFLVNYIQYLSSPAGSEEEEGAMGLVYDSENKLNSRDDNKENKMEEQTKLEANIEALGHEDTISWVTMGEEKLLKHVVATLYNKGMTLEDIQAKVKNAVACVK